MRLSKTLLLGGLGLAVACGSDPDNGTTITDAQVIAQYSSLVHANYTESLETARTLEWAGQTPALLGAGARGSLALDDATAPPTHLAFYADRLDAGTHGAVVTDYKTGRPLTEARTDEKRRQRLLASIAAGLERVDIDKYLTDALSDRAVEFVGRERDAPFFLYLAYNAPHTPMQAPDSYLKKFSHIKEEKRRIYAAMVSAMDDGIGRVLAALDEHDLRKDTLVFFLSDNGGPTRSNASDNDPSYNSASSSSKRSWRAHFDRWTNARW